MKKEKRTRLYPTIIAAPWQLSTGEIQTYMQMWMYPRGKSTRSLGMNTNEVGYVVLLFQWKENTQRNKELNNNNKDNAINKKEAMKTGKTKQEGWKKEGNQTNKNKHAMKQKQR